MLQTGFLNLKKIPSGYLNKFFINIGLLMHAITSLIDVLTVKKVRS